MAKPHEALGLTREQFEEAREMFEASHGLYPVTVYDMMEAKALWQESARQAIEDSIGSANVMNPCGEISLGSSEPCTIGQAQLQANEEKELRREMRALETALEEKKKQWADDWAARVDQNPITDAAFDFGFD